MQASFIETFQNLANAISTNENGFTWDGALRKFQYGVAGITLAALSIFETTNSMKCSTPTSSAPEYNYASSYCQEARWYYVRNSTGGREPYDEFLRYFKWYILIPPIQTIIFAALYSAFVDSHIKQALNSATQIMDLWNATIDDDCLNEAAINKTMLNMAFCSRMFSENNMHYPKKRPWYKNLGFGSRSSSRVNKRSTLATEVTVEEGDEIDLCPRNNFMLLDEAREEVATSTAGKLGQHTARYFNIYLLLVLAINLIACVFFNPSYFWFPNAIACRYRVEDLTFHWAICSVPGHRYSRVAVIIVLLNHVVGALGALLSFYYLHYFIPREILTANVAIGNYTRQPKLQARLLQCWRKYGRENVRNLTSTSKFILALIYQNIDRSLCFRLILALVDIEKDNDAIECDFPNLIKDIAAMDQTDLCLFDNDKEEKINSIRETILHPCGIDKVRNNIQSRVLIKLIGVFLDNPAVARNELFEAQLVQRFAGVQLPKLTGDLREKFDSLLKEKRETDFNTAREYFNFIGAVFDLSKCKSFFRILQPIEIGHINDDENAGSITDNGHVTVGDHPFSANRAFDASGYCWRSCDATSHNWIRRTWDQIYSIKLIAIQGSHVDETSTPIRFNFTAKLLGNDGKESWVEISETYRSYDWLKDEWRVFSVLNTETGTHPYTNAVQMNILSNDGASFIEIQKIRIYGTLVEETELECQKKNSN